MPLLLSSACQAESTARAPWHAAPTAQPSARRFTVSFAFGDQAAEAAEQSDLPDRVVKPIRQSPKYAEGRAVRIEVTSAPDVGIARKLLAIKMAD